MTTAASGEFTAQLTEKVVTRVERIRAVCVEFQAVGGAPPVAVGNQGVGAGFLHLVAIV